MKMYAAALALEVMPDLSMERRREGERKRDTAEQSRESNRKCKKASRTFTSELLLNHSYCNYKLIGTRSFSVQMIQRTDVVEKEGGRGRAAGEGESKGTKWICHHRATTKNKREP